MPLLLALALSACGAQRGTIGAVLAQDAEGRIILREVPPSLAADKAGLQAGDEILLIDGRDVRPLSVEQVHRALNGEVGSPVKLTVVRGEQILRVTVRLTPSRKHRVESNADSPAAEE